MKMSTTQLSVQKNLKEFNLMTSHLHGGTYLTLLGGLLLLFPLLLATNDIPVFFLKKPLCRRHSGLEAKMMQQFSLSGSFPATVFNPQWRGVLQRCAGHISVTRIVLT